MLVAAVVIAAGLSAPTVGGGESRCPSREALGEFGCMGAIATHTDVPRAPVDRLVNPGMARTADGHWLRWQFRWAGSEIIGLEAFERVREGGDLTGWNVPTVARSLDPVAAPRSEQGCRLVGSVIPGGRRLSAWNCVSSPGTILVLPGTGGQSRIAARLSLRYQAIAATSLEHGAGSRVTLVSFEPHARIFDLLDLTWR